MGADMTQAVQPLGNNTVEFSVSIIVSSGNGLPRTVVLNNTPCSLLPATGWFPIIRCEVCFVPKHAILHDNLRFALCR